MSYSISLANTDELLTTKFAPPRLHSSVILRESLLARLDEGLQGKLTLLSAPPGFGKTTLICQWMAARGEDQSIPPVAWVSLDAGDNDPVRFWHYVISACQKFDPGLGQAALLLLRTSQQLSFEAILTTFLNELVQFPGQGVLVLEDYYAVISPQIHELMTFLLDHLPPTLHLVITTRSDPPLPLARLRARNNLNQLGAADLRFSQGEAQTFLQQLVAYPLPPEAVTRLTDRTEGWVAGLRLVALTLQGRKESQEVEHFLTTFTGSHRHILEYLVEELLQAQPEWLQNFLLQTTFLNRLNGPLCDAVTGRSDSAVILKQLERDNLFLAPLDETHQWYRYHALFAEAMQHYARYQLGDSCLRELFSQASRWYEDHGLPAEAVEASLSAHEFGRAAGLIEEHIIAPQLVHNEYHTLRRWMGQIPEEISHSHPTLCFVYAIAILFTSDRQARATRELLQKPLSVAEQAWQAEGDRAKLGAVLTFRSLVNWLQGEIIPSFVAARQSLALLPEDDVQWRGISLIFVGVEEITAGHLTAARQTLTQARVLCEAARNMYGTLDTIFLLGQICTGQGELHQAAQLFQHVLAEAEQAPMNRDQARLRQGRALIGLGGLHWQWNHLEKAYQQATQAFESGQQLANEDLLVQSSLILARVLQARQETVQAQEILQQLLAQIRRPSLLRELQWGLAQLALRAGELAKVQHWSEAYAHPGDHVPRLQQEREALLMARILMAQGEPEAALDLLETWQPEAHSQGRRGSELEIMLLTALVYFAQNKAAQARQRLIEALKLARPEDYQRLFLDEGEPMAALLQATLPEIKEAPLLAYGQSLFATFVELGFLKRRLPEGKSLYTLEGPTGTNLIEPLSPQEQRVLGLLMRGLSNPEIAQELIVSINTVKTQVKGIYRKLDVHSRNEARDVAYRLNLLL